MSTEGRSRGNLRDPGATSFDRPAPRFLTGRHKIRAALSAATAGEGAPRLKWSALLHDVGKPGTRAVKKTKDGLKVVFQGHEVYGLQSPGGDPPGPLRG